MTWIKPIYDRTASDIAGHTAKGHINCTDLNRIEGNSEYLSAVLLSHGYRGIEKPVKTDWGEADIPFLADMDRLLANSKRLDYDLFKLKELPDSLQNPTYVMFNDIEDAQQFAHDMISKIEENYKYCGTLACGQTIILPQK